jgi:hypothetical protein
LYTDHHLTIKPPKRFGERILHFLQDKIGKGESILIDSVERSSLRRWTMPKISVLNIAIHYAHNPLKLDARECLYCDVHLTIEHTVHVVVRQFFIMLTNYEF